MNREGSFREDSFRNMRHNHVISVRDGSGDIRFERSGANCYTVALCPIYNFLMNSPEFVIDSLSSRPGDEI